MAAPLVGLAIVGRYIAQKGLKKAIKKFGSKLMERSTNKT